MNIDKVYAGKTFKNYNVLCEELGWEVKKGTDSRKAQIKELERYCKFHKEGNKFYIDEVYNEALPKQDGRGKSKGSRNNNSVYRDYIQVLVLDLLSRCKDGKLTISKTKLLTTIEMTNENYGYCSNNVPKLAKYIDASEDVVYDFYTTSNDNFKSSIESALSSLQNKRIIMYDVVTKVLDNDNKNRMATDVEKKYILLCEKQILNELGYEKVSDVVVQGQWKKYKKRVNELVVPELNIKYHYVAYEIIINEEYVKEELNGLLDLMLEDEIRKDYKNKLNTTVSERSVKNAKNRHDKGFISKKSKMRLSEDYVEKMELLTELLIDNKTINIITDITKVKVDAPITDEDLWDLFA